MKKMVIPNRDEGLVASIPIDMQLITCNCTQLYTWASGMKSPLYLDWRSIFSDPNYRGVAVQCMVAGIKEYAPGLQVIIGVETAGVPWATDISRDLQLPLARLQKKPKDHGLKTKLQGRVPAGCQVIGVIEDLISTGGSLDEACRQVEECIPGSVAVGIAVFSYLFPEAEARFEKSRRDVLFLTDIEAVMDAALKARYFSEAEVAFVRQWRHNPWQHTPVA